MKSSTDALIRGFRGSINAVVRLMLYLVATCQSYSQRAKKSKRNILPFKWDRYVFPKRRHLTTALSYVTSRNIEGLLLTIAVNALHFPFSGC